MNKIVVIIYAFIHIFKKWQKQGIETIKRIPDMSKEGQFNLVCDSFGLEKVISKTLL
ncbi:MAG: hypothetical protein JEZ08_04195 [Clostridiales bacterium]|nr:hypothetical protein [Clostridiales bacterium]